jgi:TatD DNase family protein
MYFDTHAHYDDARFSEDRYAVLDGLKAKGVDLIVNPGSDLASSKAAAALALKYAGFVYAAAGIHPHEADTATDAALAELERLCRCCPWSPWAR